MCGRYAMNKETDELIKAFVAEGGRADDWRPAYSIAPTTAAPIIREVRDEQGTIGREVTLARWDWPKPPNRPAGAPIINARMEKLPTAFWVGAFSNARCIVPMIGYYEWTGERGNKQPHYIHSDELLAAAGLTWTMDVDGERQRVYVVVTREAQDAGGEVHDRMPAFLTPDLWDDWLNPASLTVEGDPVASKAARFSLLDELYASSSRVASTMRTHPVDRRVSNTRTVDRYDPALIEPISG
ncbi:SOS response-associated peptidase [Agromyces bauzanensis]